MSYYNTTRKNKYPKVDFEQYLSNLNEPLDDNWEDSPEEIRAEMLESARAMRRGFRKTALKLREKF